MGTLQSGSLIDFNPSMQYTFIYHCVDVLQDVCLCKEAQRQKQVTFQGSWIAATRERDLGKVNL